MKTECNKCPFWLDEQCYYRGDYGCMYDEVYVAQ